RRLVLRTASTRDARTPSRAARCRAGDARRHPGLRGRAGTQRGRPVAVGATASCVRGARGRGGRARVRTAAGVSMTKTAKRALLAVTLVALAATLFFALAVTPPRENQGGEAVRLLYLHVPAAWVAYLAFSITALASVLWLVPRT